MRLVTICTNFCSIRTSVSPRRIYVRFCFWSFVSSSRTRLFRRDANSRCLNVLFFPPRRILCLRHWMVFCCMCFRCFMFVSCILQLRDDDRVQVETCLRRLLIDRDEERVQSLAFHRALRQLRAASGKTSSLLEFYNLTSKQRFRLLVNMVPSIFVERDASTKIVWYSFKVCFSQSPLHRSK